VAKYSVVELYPGAERGKEKRKRECVGF